MNHLIWCRSGKKVGTHRCRFPIQASHRAGGSGAGMIP